MTKLLYLTDVNQIQYVLDHCPTYFDEMVPLTGELVVAYELKRRKIDFLNEWDYLSSSEIEKNNSLSTSILANWYDPALAPLSFMDINLASMAKEDLAYAFLCCLNASTAFRKILDNSSIERIYGFFLEPIPIIRNGPAPAHRALRSIAQAVIFYLAEQKGITIHKLPLSLPLSNVNIQKQNKSKWSSLKKFLLKSDNAKTTFKASASKVALIFYDVMPAYEHAAIIHLFNDIDDWNLVSIKKADLDLLSLSLPKDHLNKPVTLHEFLNHKNEYTDVIPEIFNNPHFEFQFNKIWDEMNLAVHYGESYSRLLSFLQPDLVIFGHEAFTSDRLLVNISKKRKTQTLAFLHGGLGSKSGFKGIVGDADLIAVWNDRDIEGLHAYGVDYERIVKLGSVRYESKLKLYRDNQFKKDGLDKIFLKFKLVPDKPVILILTTAINVGFSLPFADPSAHLDSIDELLEVVSRRNDLQFVFKPHPGYDYYELYRRVEKLEFQNLTFLEDVDFNEIIAISDMAVLLNYFTTAALESMLSKVPVIYLDSAVYAVRDHTILLDAFRLNLVNSVEELEKKINLLLTDRDYQAQTLKESDFLINQLLDMDQRTFNEKIDELFSKLFPEDDSNLKIGTKCFQDLNNNKTNVNDLSAIPDHLILYYTFCLGAFGYKMNEHGIIKSPLYQKYKYKIIQAYILGNRFSNSNDASLIPIIFKDFLKNRRKSILQSIDIVSLSLTFR